MLNPLSTKHDYDFVQPFYYDFKKTSCNADHVTEEQIKVGENLAIGNQKVNTL